MGFDIDNILERIANSYGWEVENSTVGEWLLDFIIVKYGYYNSAYVYIRTEFLDRKYDFAYDQSSWGFDRFEGSFDAGELKQLIDEAEQIYNQFIEQVSMAYPLPDTSTED